MRVVLWINQPAGIIIMEAFLSATSIVTLAEMGDKTQLLTLLLAARFANKFAIISAIFFATIVNHAISAWFGHVAVDWIPVAAYPWIVGFSFIAVGLWILIPDKADDDDNNKVLGLGAFLATLILFSLAELGDKTQIATVILAAKYDDVLMVIAGTTLGMMLANVPVAYMGNWLVTKIPMQWMHRICCVLFIATGVSTLIWQA